MQLTVKTLQQKTLKIEAELSDTILTVKKSIEKQLGSELYFSDNQKLIFSGKILDNDKSLEQYNELDFTKGFLVVMATKSIAPSSKELHVNVEKPKNDAEVSTQPKQPNLTESPKVISSNQSGNNMASQTSIPPLNGEEYKRIVDELISMGFKKPDIIRALNASFNNPERAVEYLTNGIPENVIASFNEANTNENTVSNPNVLLQTQLLQHPSFRQMRAAIQRNPQLLSPLLQEIGRTNPNILNVINDNYEEFARLLNLQNDDTHSEASSVDTINEYEDSLPESTNNENTGVINLSQNDWEAIERIKELGFNEERIIEAFLACDKNEELTVNFLCNSFDD